MAPLKQKSEIDKSAAEAVKVIAQAAEEAAKVIANAAAEAIKIATTNNAKHDDDHDLLIELKVQMSGLKEDIKELGNKTEAQVKVMSEGTVIDLSDHEKRIRELEKSVTRILTYGSAIIIVLTLLEFLLTKIIK